MLDGLSKLSADKIVDFVHDLFNRDPNALAKLPADLASCFDGWEDCSALRQQVADAFCASARFDATKPRWAPKLPFSAAACKLLVDSPSHRLRLVGHYGDSLRQLRWNRWHPDFPSYCRATMAAPWTPAALRENPALLEEFPPCWLTAPEGVPVVLAGTVYILGD
jgi:hypothetical protein